MFIQNAYSEQCFHRLARAGTNISVQSAVASPQSRCSDPVTRAGTNKRNIQQHCMEFELMATAGRPGIGNVFKPFTSNELLV